MSELKISYCIKCGASGAGYLTELGGGQYACKYCGSAYKEESAAKDIEHILASMGWTVEAAVQRGLYAAKEEKIANCRAQLYKAVHDEYLSDREILKWADAIKAENAGDFMAEFYSVAVSKNVREINDFLDGINLKEKSDYLEDVVEFMLRTADYGNLLSVENLIDAGIHDERQTEYLNRVHALGEKLRSGLYDTELSRDAFIAYSSKDFKAVNRIVTELEEQGLECFVAMRNLRHGKGARENYITELQKAMNYCKCFVFVSSRNSRSPDCDAIKIEIPYIREYCKDKPRIEYVLDTDKVGNVAERKVKEFFDGREYCRDVDDLADRICSAMEKIAAPAPKAAPATAPKKYCIHCLTENDEDVLFCKKCGKNEFAASVPEAMEAYKKKVEEIAAEKANQAAIAKRAEEERLAEEARKAEQARLAEENARYDLVLTSAGNDKIAVIKVIRELTGLGLAEAKGLADTAPCTILKDLDKAGAQRAAQPLAFAGAQVELRRKDAPVVQPTVSASVEDDALYDVVLTSAGNNKITVIKAIREFTNIGLAEANTLVNNLPRNVVEKVDSAKARKVMDALTAAGARGELRQRGQKVTPTAASAPAHAPTNQSSNMATPGTSRLFMLTPEELYERGRDFYEGRNGVLQDYWRAAETYKKSAEKGYAPAQYALAFCYDRGRGVTRSDKQAIEWYKKAAEQGNRDAERELGARYEHGQGVKQSYTIANEWYQKAADQGDNFAQKSLIRIADKVAEVKAIEAMSGEDLFRKSMDYFKGTNGVYKDETKANNLLQKSAEKGCLEAACYLGRNYYSRRAYDQAAFWYKKAAEQGDADAQYDLGDCYNKGQGVPKNEMIAVEWYKKAAEQGHVNGQYIMGLFYDEGHVVDKDYEQAAYWYKKAAAQGDVKAQKALKAWHLRKYR